MKGQESQAGAGVPGRPLTLKPLRWPGFQGGPIPKSAHGLFLWNITTVTGPSVLFQSFQKGSAMVKV